MNTASLTRTGILIGAVLALTWIILGFWAFFFVAIAMIIVVMFAKLLGGMLPMAAKKIGVDPALMATPMISSITDMVSSVIFLFTASLVLGIAL